MNRLIRSSVLATALVIAAPGFAVAAQADCSVPSITLAQAGTSAVYVEWASDVPNVNDFTVTLDQSGATIDEQSVSADANSATFFGVELGEDYHVRVSANTDSGTFTSLPSEAISVTDAYIPVDPPVIKTQELDVATVTVTLSEDGQSWILSIPAIDQQGERALYGFVTADGQACWAYSPDTAVEGDVVSCDVALLEDGSTPEVTSAYYQKDWVMYSMMRGGGLVTTTIPGIGDDISETTVPEGTVDPSETVVPTPYEDFVVTSATPVADTPNIVVSVGVLLAGAVAVLILMRPRRVAP